MNKLIRKGCVAVIYSPEYGAGWSTWNQEVPEILFDPAIVELVEKDQWDELEVYVTLKYPGLYDGGLPQLAVQWISIGSEFRVHEYDGSESIEVKEDLDWVIA